MLDADSIMDANFSVAIHILILVSEAETPLSSQEIAQSVGVNASLVRKVAGLLRHAGLIRSRKGVTGFSLCRPVQKISLAEVYEAVYPEDNVHLFAIHKNPNDQCAVGRYIRPVLAAVFSEAEKRAAEALHKTVLADLITDMRARLEDEEKVSAQGGADEGSDTGTL